MSALSACGRFVDRQLSREVQRPKNSLLLLAALHFVGFRMLVQNIGTDHLTQVGNRATLERRMARLVRRAATTQNTLAFVMVDIDHFKKVNDEHGHATGDAVLAAAARALAEEARRLSPGNRYGGRAVRRLSGALAFEDPFAFQVARYGGEEFAALLPGCDMDEALRVAERLRHVVAGSSAVPLTASAGVALYPRHARRGHTLMEAADAALYVSKQSGRNRTTVAPERQAPPPLGRVPIS